MGLDCEKFDFIDAPSSTAIENALKQLRILGAIKSSKNELTRTGKNMSKFPLDPKYSKLLLAAPAFGCLEEVKYKNRKFTSIRNGLETIFFFIIASDNLD